MTDNADKDSVVSFLKKAVEGISDPYALALVVVICFALWRTPSIIKAVSEYRTADKASKIEMEGRQRVLDSRVKSLEDKRLKKKRRKRHKNV